MEPRTIENFSNYLIYPDGRIYGLKSKKFLSPATTKDGYLRVAPYQDDGKQKTIGVHRLVALAFIPNPNNLSDVNHKDENKLNNNVENLEWISREDNQLYGSHQKVLVHPMRQVCMKDINTNEILQVFNTLKEAELFIGVDGAHANISRACKHATEGRQNRAYGYRWTYFETET